MNDDELPIRVVRAPNLAALEVAELDWDVFAQLRSVKELLTKDNRPFLVLELAEATSGQDRLRARKRGYYYSSAIL